jgi:hypothetical protein
MGLAYSANPASVLGMEARRSGEHVRTWWQNLTHTAGGGSGGVGCFSLAPAVGPGAGGSWRGPRTQSDVVVGQSARPRGPCASAPAAGVGWGVACGDSQAATSCPSRDWWAEGGPSSLPPRGGAPAGAAVGVGSWTRSRRGWWAPARTRVGWLVVGPRWPPRAVPCPSALPAVGTRSWWGRGCW